MSSSLQGFSPSYSRMHHISQDPIIARKTFKLTGSILSNNTVTIPDPNGEVRHANLIGRYVLMHISLAVHIVFGSC